MERDNDHSVIPDGELKCVWMEAGIVGYKLCDKQYRCETCPFDAVIRIQHVGTCPNTPSGAIAPSNEGGARRGSITEMFEYQLNEYCRAFEHPSLPDDRAYTRSFGWVKKHGSDSATFGITPLALHMLGPVTSIVLPQAPTHVQHHSPCVWVVHREGAAALRAPLAGTIVTTNGRLREAPNLLADSPYHDGWLARLQIREGQTPSEDLLDASEAGRYFRSEAKMVRKHFRSLFDRSRLAVGITMNDGGQVVSSIQEIVGTSAYFDFVARLLATL